MAETQPATGEEKEIKVTPPPADDKPDNGKESDGSKETEEPKGDLKIALAREREEKRQLSDRLKELESKNKELERSGMSDDDAVEAEFKELAKERIFAQVNEEEFEKLPATIKAKLRDNPWALLSQTEFDKATKFAEGRREHYKIASGLAVDSIKSLLEDVGSKSTQQPGEKKDGDDKGGEKKDEGGDVNMSEGELLVLSFEDPKKYAEIVRNMKQRS